MIFGGKHKKRTFVLGLDGVPYSFLSNGLAQETMPHLLGLFNDSPAKRMNSVYPTVSSVAWTSFATGLNPAGHHIFGFVDRRPNPFQIEIPTARNRGAKTIWQELSEQDKKVIVINVPITYPPEEVNGILVSCFLCTDINKSAYPQEFSNYLKEKGYIIDVDAHLAKENKRKFIDDLHLALQRRFEVTFDLMDKEEWDYFQLHIMETDRLFHFLWSDIENKNGFYKDIINFFEKLDVFIKKLNEKLLKSDRLIILSDHGFCAVKAEVQLNAWLKEQGLLKFTTSDEKLQDYDKNSTCYSLLPGRIFINLEGREEKGRVKTNNYDSVRNDIKSRLMEFKDPEGEKIIEKVFFREELYSGPYLEDAADIIAHPKRGYDLKGRTGNISVFEHSHLNGMHTYDDAFIYSRNCDISRVEDITAVKKAILSN